MLAYPARARCLGRSGAVCATRRSRRCAHPGTMRDRARRRGTINQPSLSLGAIPPDPLPASPLAHTGGLSRRHERPALIHDATNHRQPALRAERSVTVQFHPVSSLGLRGFDTTQPPRRPGRTTLSGTTPRGDDRNRTGVDGFVVRRNTVLSAYLSGFRERQELSGALKKRSYWESFGRVRDALPAAVTTTGE